MNSRTTWCDASCSVTTELTKGVATWLLLLTERSKFQKSPTYRTTKEPFDLPEFVVTWLKVNFFHSKLIYNRVWEWVKLYLYPCICLYVIHRDIFKFSLPVLSRFAFVSAMSYRDYQISCFSLILVLLFNPVFVFTLILLEVRGLNLRWGTGDIDWVFSLFLSGPQGKCLHNIEKSRLHVSKLYPVILYQSSHWTVHNLRPWWRHKP